MPAKTITEVKSLSLPAGTYIVCACFEFGESFDAVTMLMMKNVPSYFPTVRGTGAFGGGLSCSIIITLAEQTTIFLCAYQGSEKERVIQNIAFDAIKIK